MEDSSSRQGTVTCASWIRRPENAHLVVVGKARHRDQPSLIEIFSFDSKTSSLSSEPSASHVIEEGDPVSIAVHPSGDDFVCSITTGGCNLDSEFLATTSTDGSARIWKTNDGVPVTSLTRNSDEKIELCRFSKDGTKPFLFCTVQKGNKALTVVWDISEWKKIGHKRLLRKPASVMSMSLDGKYLALGSKDGDVCVVELKKMEVSHWSKRLHLGSRIASLEFCPSERIVLTTSKEWGAMVTKLNVAADWKEWQVYLVLLGLFLASAVAFYIFFENSDSFWNFPLGRDQPAKPRIEAIFGDPQSDDQNMWSTTDHLDL
ncbi:SEC12-like protein 1 isoform X2 [Camellia sinensis]|uniref:SEC12-like protein 1 isoform X2 n=1 Tax=Camellia sinensis TaxID=4442 RepID=UPI0010357340|nr:SEC12-like protein 1 isoform X2 [Camellia sinensis]